MENTQIKCCKKCGETKLLSEFQRWFKKSTGKYYYANCKKCQATYCVKYKTEINPEKYKERKKREKQTDSYKKYQKKYIKNYIKTRKERDILFYLACKQRTIIYRAFKNRGLLNKESAELIIGLSLQDFREYLFSTKPENLKEKECHVDHIIPLKVAFDIEDQELRISKMYELNHYTNLRLISKEDNLKKGCKIVS